MRQVQFKSLVPVMVRVVLGGIFLYAGVMKIADPVGFAGNIAAYRILPYFANYLVAAILPWVEVMCGVLLICGWRVRAGALLIALMNLVFIAALLSAIVRGLDIDCGCFRPQSADKTSPWLAVGRDLLFLGMALYLIVGKRGRDGKRIG